MVYWEAVLNIDTGQSKTYYASLIHDVFYQFSGELRSFVNREEVDREFYSILKRDGMRCAGVYYIGVRIFGWIWWYKRQKIFMGDNKAIRMKNCDIMKQRMGKIETPPFYKKWK
jgi:hypothetical protein